MNIQMLMQQAQTMQKQVEAKVKKAKESLSEMEVHSESGGGLVKVTMNGRFVVKKLSIDPELLEDSLMEDDKEMIEDLVAAAMNDAVRQAEELNEKTMAGATAGMNLPPGMGGMF